MNATCGNPPAMKYKSQFPRVIQTLADKLKASTGSHVAKDAGVSKATVSRIANREQKDVNLENFLGMLDGLGASIQEFFPEEFPRPSDFDFIPKIKARLGAGSSLITDGEATGLLAFRKEFLASIGPASRLVLMDVMGDSMEPTLRDRDTVLLNTQDIDIRSGEIYAVRIDDELLVKRVLREPGRLVLNSDNQQYANMRVEFGNENFDVMGRVRWMARRFR